MHLPTLHPPTSNTPTTNTLTPTPSDYHSNLFYTPTYTHPHLHTPPPPASLPHLTQNGNLENLFQNSLKIIHCHGCIWIGNNLDWVSFGKLTGFQGIHFVSSLDFIFDFLCTHKQSFLCAFIWGTAPLIKKKWHILSGVLCSISKLSTSFWKIIHAS